MEKNASILVVDDDKEIADLVEIYLVNDGYQVLKASDGEQCLQTLKEHPEVRMLILDIMMPGIDGLETAEILMKKDPDATILMLSSLCDSGTLEEVRSVGVKYLIPKPWEDEVLLATLDMLKKHCEEHKED